MTGLDCAVLCNLKTGTTTTFYLLPCFRFCVEFSILIGLGSKIVSLPPSSFVPPLYDFGVCLQAAKGGGPFSS